MRINLRGLAVFLLWGLVMGSIAVFAAEKVEPPAACQRCGMNRTAFARSRMLVTYSDGTSTGTCSLHCTAEELKASRGKKVKTIQVADYPTEKLINAKSAIWVIGGKKAGVMTSVAKWAFARKQDAQAFIKENGGKVATFDEALKKATMEDMDNQEHMGHKM
jgi:copper chaperone NosL